MKQFIIRRILISFLVLIGVSFILYSIIHFMPGDIVTTLTSGNPAITEAAKERLRDLYGVNKGLLEGYIDWANAALHGDFGESFIYKKPVIDIIKDKMWISFSLAGIAFIIKLALALPLGAIAAVNQYSKKDYIIVGLALAGISIPSFFFAAILQKVFALDLAILPLQGMVTARKNYHGFALILDIGKHFILPIIVFVVVSTGIWLRYTRNNMIEVLGSDYVRTARAKGVPERIVIGKHAFRNTLIPIITMIGGSFPALFSGAIITEGIFSIDGLGNVALKAVNQSDIPFLMGYFMFLAVLTLVGTLISDILYAVVDPRVKYN